MKPMKTQTAIIAVLTALMFLPFAKVEAQRTISGNKNVTVVEHEIADFSAIEAGAAFNIILEQSATPMVRIETDENLHEQISLRVRGAKLSIGSKGISNPTKLDVHIFYTSLNSAEISGAASLSANNVIESREFLLDVSGAAKANLELDVEELITEISGASKVTLEGRADNHITNVSGASNLHAVSLLTNVTGARVSGAAKARITATEKIDSNVSGAGKLEYFDGQSMVTVRKEGSFSIHIDEDIDIDSLDYIDIQTYNDGDSVRVRIGNLEIEVHDGDQTRVKVGSGKLEVDETGKVQFKKEPKKQRFNGHWAGFYLGINGYLTPENKIDLPGEYGFLDLRYEKSINVQLNFYEQNFNLISNKLGLVTGLGIEWNNYRFNDKVKLDPNRNQIARIEAPEKDYTKSKLNVRYLNIPLIIELQTNSKSNMNSFHFGVGVIGGLRIGSHSKNVYENNKRQKEKVRDDFHLSPLKADATVRIGWGKLNLYGNYSLLTLFRDNRGPELYPFSAGITLLSF
jgi:hypothetical protein